MYKGGGEGIRCRRETGWVVGGRGEGVGCRTGGGPGVYEGEGRGWDVGLEGDLGCRGGGEGSVGCGLHTHVQCIVGQCMSLQHAHTMGWKERIW